MTAPLLASASELVSALRRREVSSSELLDAYLARVTEHNPRLGAVVTMDVERAPAEAAAADESAARGETLGPLHGLPITIKDSIETAGMVTTCGVPDLADYVPARDAPAVARLRAAGAIVFGKTNTPPFAADAQTANPVFGVTNNPWDHSRSPGGSSGGPAAAVAASLTGFDLGSDLGGSIRMPAGYCGVYGLRPSNRIVPASGHIPPRPFGAGEIDMGTVGPLTRSASDLGLLLDVLAGPDAPDAAAWHLRLPPPRAQSLAGYRIALWLDDPACPVDTAVTATLTAAADALRAAGAKISEPPPPVSLGESHRLFQRLIQPLASMGMSQERFAELCALADDPAADGASSHVRFARDVTARCRDAGFAAQERLQLIASWEEFFRDHDALLCPVTPTTALPHNVTRPDGTARPLTVSPEPGAAAGSRWISVNGTPRDYWDQVIWTQAISVAYLPVAAVPAGRDASGLPAGMQIVGPYLADRTVIDLARRFAEILGGFTPPPAYSGM